MGIWDDWLQTSLWVGQDWLWAIFWLLCGCGLTGAIAILGRPCRFVLIVGKASRWLPRRLIQSVGWLRAIATAHQQAERHLILRKQTEAQLRQRTQDLEKTLRELQHTQTHLIQSEKMSSLGQLVAGVAHEINNPVNFVCGNLVYAERYTENLIAVIRAYQTHYPQPDPEIESLLETMDLPFVMTDLPKLLQSMQQGTQRLREIITSLHNFSRLDEATLRTVDLHDGLESTLMILQNRLKPKSSYLGITVIKHYGNLPNVECYPGQLNQVLMNLLVNAIDALEERDQARSPTEIAAHPSQIEIFTELINPDWVRIRIKDNGPGIPETVQSRMFEPFFTTKGAGKGTGLGMSISHQIVVEKHHGTLIYCSEPGQGAEFWIEIPCRQPALATAHSEPQPPTRDSLES